MGKVAFKTVQDEEVKKLRWKGEYTGEDENERNKDFS